jgi:hypothetical protein
VLSAHLGRPERAKPVETFFVVFGVQLALQWLYNAIEQIEAAEIGQQLLNPLGNKPRIMIVDDRKEKGPRRFVSASPARFPRI